jgi:hypothetical protein
MSKKIKDRIKDSFDSSKNKDQVGKYLEWVREAIKENRQAAQKSVFFTLAAIVLFELIVSIKVTHLTLGPLDISQDSIILVFIPTAVAYLSTQVIFYECRHTLIFRAYTATMAEWNAEAEANDLEVLVAPPDPLHWNTTIEATQNKNKNSLDSIESIVASIIILAMGIGLLGFQFQAFIILFRTLHASNFLVWVNLICTVGLIIASAYEYVAVSKGDF